MAEHIRKDDTLNEGRVKLNRAIDDSNIARDKAESADIKSDEALANSESTQTQLDTIVIEGDSSVEAAQARVDSVGKEYSTLKERLDEENREVTQQLAENDESRHFESMISRKNTKKPMISITDDDGNRGFYTILFELAKEYNIPMTSAMITNSQMGFPDDVRNYYNRQYHYDEVMEMKESGLIEFVSHTHEHDVHLTEKTDAELHDDFRKSKEFMKKWGFNHRGVVYPYATYDDRVLGIAKEYFDYSTGAAVSTNYETRVVTPPINNYTLPRQNFNAGFTKVKNLIDETVEKDGWLILIGHIDQEATTEQDYRDVIEYALSAGVEFVTLDEGVKSHANIAQFGGTNNYPDNSISADGQIFGSSLGRVVFERNRELKVGTPLSYFKKSSITVSLIGANQDGGKFPNSVAGILTTTRHESDWWSHRKFITIRDNKSYYSYWDDDLQEWSDFVTTDATQYLGKNAVSLSDSPSDPKLEFKITYTNIDSTKREEFPEQRSGTFVTNAFTRDGFAYQEYHIYQSSKVYKRFWRGSEWSNFVLVQDKISGASINMPGDNGFTGETHRDEFDWGITYSLIGSTTPNPGTPNESAGRLKTEIVSKGGAPRHNIQTFVSYDSGDIFIRRGVASTSNGWDNNWKKIPLEVV